MNDYAWRRLKKRLFFTSRDVAALFGVAAETAHVFCSRQVKRGSFLRLRKDFYVLADRLPFLDEKEFFVIANYLQVPSYISFTSALAYHGVSTQVLKGWYESAALKRSIRYDGGGATFSYFRLKREYYFGFSKVGSFFIASKEKAFLDACHLAAYGRYSPDWSALDRDRLDRENLESMMERFPDRTCRLVRRML
ncbi:MAG: hypothetical protein PHU03_08455 [Syntrophales bacterium]|nr:hypothetical protein [Syntrophales bacterium]